MQDIEKKEKHMVSYGHRIRCKKYLLSDPSCWQPKICSVQIHCIVPASQDSRYVRAPPLTSCCESRAATPNGKGIPKRQPQISSQWIQNNYSKFKV